MELTIELYEHIFAHYKELREYETMKELLEGAIELPLDNFRREFSKLKDEKTELEEQKTELEEQKTKLEEQNKKLSEEIEILKRQLM